MSCKVTYKNDGSIDNVFAPNGNESKLFASILALPELKGNKEEARRLQAQVYTPRFKQWFGDFETLEELKLTLNDNENKGFQVYKQAYLKDPEQAAFEIAVQANSSQSEKDGVEEMVGVYAVELATQLYPNAAPGAVFNRIVSKVVDENGEPEIIQTGEATVFVSNTEDNILDVAPDKIKSIYNRGSFLTEANQTVITPATDDLTEPFFEVSHEGGKVGFISTENDGTYLTTRLVQIETQNQNVGTNAHLHLAKWAKDRGLTLRSDNLGTLDGIGSRMSEGAMRLWQRFVDTGQARREGDYFIFDGNPESVVNNIYFSADPQLESSKASSATLDNVKKFLKAIGLTDESIKEVTEVMHDGKPIAASAMADLISKSIQIAEGKEDVTLPEEAMHFMVALIRVNRPKLYESLVNNVRDYRIYKQLINSEEYTTSELYRKPNGSLNLEMIKEEAVAKVLAEYLINELQGYTDKPELLLRARNWWKTIVDWVKNFFGVYQDPFEQVTTDLKLENFEAYGDVYDLNTENLGERTKFLSASGATIEERENQFINNKGLFENIKNKTKILKIEKLDNKYYKNGVEGKRRVSDLVEDYYKDLFKNKLIPEDMKGFYEQTREDGTLIHEVIQDVLRRAIDPETGLMRDEALDPDPVLLQNPIAQGVYNYLATNIYSRLSSYKEGTRFLFEQVVYDSVRDIYGTVDFIAIDPNGKLDILDWKTIYYEEFSKNRGIKEFKEEAFNIQIKEYKRILTSEYGVTNFGQLRAIPITKYYVQIKDNQGVPTGDRKLWKIGIGSVDPKEIKDDSLKPVILKEESTGNAKLDNFVNVLYKVLDNLKARKTAKFDSGVYDLVKRSIFELRTEQNINFLYQYSAIELTNVKNLLDNIKLNKETYTNENINNVLGELNYYYELLGSLEKSSFMVREDFLDKEAEAKLNKLVGKYENAREQINELRRELSDKVAKSNGLFNLLKPERVMHFWNKYMRTMSQSQSTSVQLLYKMVQKVFNRVDLENTNQERELVEVKLGVDNWAKKKGVSGKEALKHLLKFDKNGDWTGNMISTVDPEFYKQREAVLKTNDKDQILRWFAENYDLAAYETWYNNEYDRYKNEVDLATYSEDPAVNSDTKKYLITAFEKRYNIVKHPFTAIAPANKQVWSKNIRRDLWYSKEYEFLLKKENEELLNAYNKFTSINKELAELGIIEAWRENIFVPSVRKDFAETLAFEEGGLFTKLKSGLKAPFTNFKDSVKVNDQELNYSGYINPLTGERENKLFAAHVAELGEFIKDPDDASKVKLSYSKKSTDLFKVYSLMNREKLKYKYLTEVENIAQSLRHVEAQKGSILTNKFGRVQRDAQGNTKIDAVNNKENLEMYEKHLRASMYGEVIQNDSDSYFEVSWNKFADAWNNTALGKIKKFKKVDKEKPTKISAMKILMKLNNFNQLRIMGLNLATAVSNLFGGVASTYLINKQLFTDRDLTEAATQMISGTWYATEDMKKRAALVDYFLPLLDNRPGFKASQLSASETVQILSQEWIMAPQRKTEHIVQLNIFLATIANTTVIDGQLVNIRKFVQDKNGWNNRFDLSSSERDSLGKKVEKEISDMKKAQSLTKLAKFETVKQGGKDKVVVTIPGIERSSQTVEELREMIQNLSKNVLGSSSEFDLAAYKYNIWGRLFMTFKNWIPRQADVRFGEFRYDAGHDAYEWGRARMFFRAFGTNWMQSFMKMIPYLGRGISSYENKTYLIDKAKVLYQEKVNLFKDLGLYNEEQFISEADFIQAFIQGVDAEFTEFRTITLLLLLFLSAILAPDDDDDEETKGAKRKLMRQVDKLTDELSFFYSPKSFLDVAGKPLPVMGFAGDMYKLVVQTGKQWMGVAFNIKDGQWEDEAKPLKYLFKAFPVSKELLGYMPIIDPEFAKEMGIKLQVQNSN
jgi:hypothetical protein